jgi:hypothetical protein|nr:MAG TPA: hypothetical protein [Caudoviricetes sp.]
MINTSLHVYDICHDCPKFKPKYEEVKMFSDNKSIMHNIDIYCENNALCEFLKTYLKGEN